MKELATTLELDLLLSGGCADPNCHHTHEKLDKMYLHGSCHPRGPIKVLYHKGGLLQIKCYICGELISAIKVASPL